MELILEVERPGGQRSWHPLASTPLAVGRAPANDIIVDDPYVDGTHLEVRPAATGGWVARDLGSTNGVFVGDQRGDAEIPLAPGQVLRIGRTTLRVLDRHATVPPALVDHPSPLAPATPATPATTAPAATEPTLAPWLGTRRASPYAVAAIAVFTASSYLSSTSRSVGGELFTMASGAWLFLAIWAGIWAIFSRIIVHRFHYNGHLIIASVASVAALVIAALDSWVTFLLPSADFPMVTMIGGLAFVAVTVGAHLGLATHATREKLRRTVGGMFVAMGLLLSVSTLLEEDRFSPVAQGVTVLKPLAPTLVPTISSEAFGAVVSRLQEEVDELAEEGELPPDMPNFP